MNSLASKSLEDMEGWEDGDGDGGGGAGRRGVLDVCDCSGELGSVEEDERVFVCWI